MGHTGWHAPYSQSLPSCIETSHIDECAKNIHNNRAIGFRDGSFHLGSSAWSLSLLSCRATMRLLGGGNFQDSECDA